MKAEAVVQLLLVTPYKRGGDSWAGVDCWGLVELFYSEVYGIDLTDRRSIPPGPEGIQRGFDGRVEWIPVPKPLSGDLVVMSGVSGRKRLASGHIGVLTPSGVLHADEKQGCAVQPLESRQIKRRITGFFRHRSLNT